MTTICQHLREKNPGGIPYLEAVQLFLWIFCCKDVLPPELGGMIIGREELVAAFDRLKHEGMLKSIPCNAKSLDGGTLSGPDWNSLVDKLLDGTIELDPTFPQRAHQYL